MAAYCASRLVLEAKAAAAPCPDTLCVEVEPRAHEELVYSPGPGVPFMLPGTPGSERLEVVLNGTSLWWQQRGPDEQSRLPIDIELGLWMKQAGP
jgi:hypothetical protein